MKVESGKLKARERIIQLQDSFECPFPDGDGCKKSCHACMADHLIANGVTFMEENAAFGKWIPVTEQLPIFHPGRRRSVLVTLEDRDGKRLVTTAKYDEEFSEWTEFKDYRYTQFKVLAWMPKPERYEGE